MGTESYNSIWKLGHSLETEEPQVISLIDSCARVLLSAQERGN